MNKYKIIITALFVCLFSHRMQGQSIDIDLPHFSNQGWWLRVFNGNQMDTIAKGALDDKGRVTIAIPESHKNYRGMSQWLLTNGGGFDIIVADGEKLSVSCPDKVPGEDNIFYNDTRENTFLIQRYNRQQDIFQKIEALHMVIAAYKGDKALEPIFEEELNKQMQAYAKLVEETKQSKYYAARFCEIVDFTRGIPPSLSTDANVIREELLSFFINEMDIEALYSSGHWMGVLAQWLESYGASDGSDKEIDKQVIDDYNKISARIQDPTVKARFASTVQDLLSKNGKADLSRKLGVVGLEATDFVLSDSLKLSDIKGKRLLFFYGSFCDLCQKQIDALSGEAKHINRLGVTVIGIDSEREIRKERPWPYDMADSDFKIYFNYNLNQTPTYVLIDEMGKAVDIFYTLEDVKTELEIKE